MNIAERKAKSLQALDFAVEKICECQNLRPDAVRAVLLALCETWRTDGMLELLEIESRRVTHAAKEKRAA